MRIITAWARAIYIIIILIRPDQIWGIEGVIH
jgi:hypothetical protein